MNDPFVLIADEPTGNLDERATRGVCQLLREINAVGDGGHHGDAQPRARERHEYRVLEVNRGQIVFDSTDGRGARKSR